MTSFSSEIKFYSKQHFITQNLAGQSLTGISFSDCTFEDCDWTQVKLHRCEFSDCTFKQCNLSNLNLDQSRFFEVNFRFSKVIGINWTKAYWPRLELNSPIHFDNSILSDSIFMGLSLKKIKLTNCRAHDLDLRNTKLSEADLSGTDFTGTLFNRTDLSKAIFCDSSNFDIDINFNTIKGAKFCRFEAVRLLESLGIELID